MTTTTGLEDGAAYVDGRLVPIAEACIPITDTGFTRSDATYDVVSVWDGAFFRLEDHLARFERSCRRLRLTPPHDLAGIRAILVDLVVASGLREAYVEMICTRGRGAHGSRDPRTFVNRFYAFAVPYVWILAPDDADTGMNAVVARSARRIPPTSLDPTVKNFHWGDLTAGLFEAYDRGADQVLLLDQAGNLTEGPGYNVFALHGSRLATPAEGVLEGITRRTVLELARLEGLETDECVVSEADLRSATELFATSTAGGVMPITTLDGRPVGDGDVGALTRRLRERYWAAHRDAAYLTRALPPVDRGAASRPQPR